MRASRADRGSAGIAVLAVVVAVVTLSLAAVALGAALAARQRVIAAADQAAIAAADAVSGALAGDPCELAGSAARANGAVLGECRIEGWDARVTVSATVLGSVVTARSRAGPPPDDSPRTGDR